MVVLKFGSPTWARTRDLRINSPSLYRLSYRGMGRIIMAGKKCVNPYFQENGTKYFKCLNVKNIL